MWFQKKEEMYLGSFVRMLATVLIKDRKVDLSIANEGRDLSPEDEMRVQEELPSFRVTLLALFLIERGKFGKKIFTAEEISSTVGQGTVLAMKDNGMGEEELIIEGEKLKANILYYFEALEKISEAELQSKGIFFYLCSVFADLMMASVQETANQSSRLTMRFIFFDIAKQVYQNNSEAFKEVIKTVKFLD